MFSVADKEENSKSYIKLAQLHAAIQRREHEVRRKMIIKNILKKEGDINYKIPATDYLKTFNPDLIGCSALHSAFSAGNVDVFNDILQCNANFDIKNNNDMTIIHRAVEEDFNKHETLKLTNISEQYDNMTTQEINSFMIMKENIVKRSFDKCDNWRLRGKLQNPFVDAILSAQIEGNNPENPCSINGISHFHVACMANNAKAVELFLENGVDVNETVKTDSPIYPGYTPLHFAVRCSGLETTRLLLKYRIKADSKNGHGKTPLHILLDHNIKIIEWLNAKRMLPYENSLVDFIENKKILKLLMNETNSTDGLDLLHFNAACTMDNTVVAESLLQKVESINRCADKNLLIWAGYTALHFAAFFNMNIVKLLLNHGADIEAQNASDVTPFDILIARAHVEDIYFILSQKDDWKNIILSDDKTRMLDLILSMKNPIDFDCFLQNIDINVFIPVNSSLWPGYTILHLAIAFSETMKRIKFLSDITDCTKINCEDEFDKCCQEQEESYLEKIKVCLKRNANVIIQDVRGWTPIHLAFRQRKTDVVKLLLQHLKTFENVSDRDNLHLLHIACAVGCENSIEKLLSRKEDLNIPVSPSFKWESDFYGCAAEEVFDVIGSTPLHFAVTGEFSNVAKTLVKSGADVNAKDIKGLTPIDRLVALENILKSSDEVLHWYKQRQGLLRFHDMDRDVYNAFRNFKDIYDTLVTSPTSQMHIDSNSNDDDDIDDVPTSDTRFRFALESGESLLRRGVDILEKRDDDRIWLFDKLEHPYQDDILFILTVLKRDESIKRRLLDEFGWTTLHVACCLLNVELAKESLDEGIDVNACTNKDSPIYRGCTPLHILMLSLHGSRHYYDNKTEYDCVLQMLLDKGADVTLTDVNNDTPLHRTDYSTYWNSRSFKNSLHTHLLLKHVKHFDANPINDRGISVFHVACLGHNVRVVEEFLNRKVNVNQPIDFFATLDIDEFNGYTPLHLAVKGSNSHDSITHQLETVELLLKYGANVQAEDASGDTPLHVAAASDLPKDGLLEKLLGYGADVQVENVYGKTPFERLLDSRNTTKQEIEMFLNRGCRLNTFNSSSQVGYMSLLLYCKISPNIAERVKMAMDCPSVNEIDDIGRTAVHNIVANNNFPGESDFDVVEYFMKYGGDIDHQDKLGRTALHLAAQFRNYEGVRGLLSSGADINIVDRNGQTAFAYTLDSETCLVDQTLDFNVCTNKHIVIKVFVEYVYHMQLRGLYVNDINRQAQIRAINDLDVELTKISDDFESVKDEKIGSSQLILDDFMSETGAIVSYPIKSQTERNEINHFFTVTIMDDRFYEQRFLFKLQYRKALARSHLVERAKDALNVILDFPLPYLCYQVIQKYLSNADLKNLIASTT